MRRHLRPSTTGALAAVALALAAAAPAQSSAAVDGRLQGSFLVKGKITRADGVRDERKGQGVRRTWRFESKCAAGPPCKSVVLHRERTLHKVDKLTLTRDGTGSYSGKGHFYFAVRCGGRVYAKGGEAKVKIAVTVTRATTVQGDAFATELKAEYSNPRRINHTQCNGSLGRDGATYKGTVNDVPGPPRAAFTWTGEPTPSTTVSFEDTSKRGPGGSPIKGRLWDFGDPSSGSANSASGRTPKHTYPAPGDYVVKHTVTDDNGLATEVTTTVHVPRPSGARSTGSRARR